VVADLTTRALERDGTATLSRVLSSCKELHKEVLEVGKAQASQAKDAPTAADAEALAENGCSSIAAVLERPSSVKLLLQMMDIQKALRKVPVIELDMPSVVLVGLCFCALTPFFSSVNT
jgi:GTP1/Obg family GTP-binding protein